MAFLPKAFDRLKSALKKTADVMTRDVRTFIPGRQIDESFLTEVEEKLLAADVGVANAEKMVGEMRQRWRMGKIKNRDQCVDVIRDEMLQGWGALSRDLRFAPTGHPTVILVAGVNGAGKTTSIAKLCWYLKNQLGKKVMVAAADTFRAGAVHQLTIWADRLGVEIVKHKQNADPAAVAYDACEAAKTRGLDVLIVDTAGRLPTQENLIRELVKIRDVVAKRIEGAPHESLLVLDATTGQNAINQAKVFGNAINTTGIILAKLDGTAKGGVILSIRDQLNLPVKFIGLGETPEDIAPFNPEDYVNALLGERPT